MRGASAGSSRHRAAAGLASLLVGATAHAGRPLDTDDAAVIDRGACQLEAFANRVAPRGPGPTTGDYGLAPSCNPFGWGELAIAAGRAGVGDAGTASVGALQLKTVPVAITAQRAGFGASAALAEGFVQDRRRPASRNATVAAIVSVPLATGVQVDANAGWQHDFAPALAHRDHLLWGLAGEWTIASKTTLVAERFAVSAVTRVTRIGASYALTPWAAVDAAFARRDGARVATIGVTLLTPALTPR